MGEDNVPRQRQIPLAGWVAVCSLIGIPLLLLAVVGRPGTVPLDVAVSRPGPGSIASPVPHAGLHPKTIQVIFLASELSLVLALAIGLLVWVGQKRVWARSAMPLPLRLVLVALLGAISLVLYECALLIPFPLEKFYNLVGIGAIANRDSRVAVGVALALVVLFILYGLAYVLSRRQKSRALWAIVLIGALFFALANLLTAITTTMDPYDYIARGRITAVHGGNPYVQVPQDYSNDPFMQYVSWRDKTSAYGPLWESLSALFSRLAGNQLRSNLLFHKGFAMACYLFSVFLIAATLRRFAPERALSGTILFAWNPLVLMEGVGNSHNDLLMVALLLAAFYFLSRPAPGARTDVLVGAIALLLLGAAVLVKFIPILLLPLFLLYLLSDRKGWWRRVGLGLLLLVPLVLLFAMYYLPFWASWPAFLDTFGRRVEMFRMTVTSVAKEALQQWVGEQTALAVVRWPLLGLFGLSYLVVVGRVALIALSGGGRWPQWVQEYLVPRPGWRGRVGRFLAGDWERWQTRSWEVVLRASLVILLLYLLLGNFWWWPWYLIWPIALLALGEEERMIVPLALLASCAGELSHLAWNFLWYRWGITWETTYQIDALVVLAVVVPALVVYALPSLTRRRKEEAGAGPSGG